MSRQINQPINQVRLTNVAVVRYTVKGKRFEIACYRNKVLDYRAGLETDLSEVLQTDRIFTNVSKGRFAATSDLKKAFGMTDQEEIAQLILQKGKSLQVSDLERSQALESTVTQVATWVAHNCVHPATNRPYTVFQVKQALGKNYQVQAHKAMKKQYLDAVKFLKTVIPIERAKMELSLQYAVEKDALAKKSLEEVEYLKVKENTSASTTTITLQVDPSLYRQLNQLAQDLDGRLEILQQQVVLEEQGDVDLEQDLQKRQQQQKQTHATDSTTLVDSFDSDDEEAVALAEKVRAVRMQTVDDSTRDDTDEEKSSSHVEKETEQHYTPIDEKKEDHADDDEDDSDDDYFQSQASQRKNQRKAQKKKNKKAKRRQQQQLQQQSLEDSGEEDEQDKEMTNTSEPKTEPSKPTTSTASNPNAKSCNTCGGSFAKAADYRAHFRSDWHRFNQKLKVKGLPPVSEQEFSLCDADAFFGGVDD